MTIKGIPILDILSVAAGIIGAIAAFAAQSGRLPRWARKWLSKIGVDRITDAIDRVEQIAGLTPEQRRKQAVISLQRFTVNELGFTVPTSIANLLVEFVYQQWKRGKQ
jgi:hypothetical protein